MEKTQEKINISINKKEQIYQIIRLLLLIIYGCALPFAILFAMFFGLLADYASNDTVFWFMSYSLISIPISIVIAMIMSIRFKKNIWLVLPILSVALLLISSKTADVVRERDYNAKQLIPLSQRGLPLPSTDVPVTLPPDPGEAGKATLAGIDSNNDGVRDDLEREIVYMYPQNNEVRRVLRAMVKKEQDVVTTTGDHEHFKELEVSSLRLWNCYNNLAFGRSERDYSKANFLISLVRNTPERLKNSQQNAKIALPYSSEVGAIDSCEQIKGQY